MNPTYVLPGLIPENFSGTLPPLQYLDKLLAHANVTPLESMLYTEHFSKKAHPQSYALTCAEEQGIAHLYPHWLMVSPIHLHVEGDGLILMEGHALSVSDSEAQSLISLLNNHYEQDGLKFFYLHPSRWLVGTHRNVDIHTTHPLLRTGRTIAEFLPQGEEARFWRQLFNEIQMLFHEHEVNLQREQSSQKTISGVWLWDVTSHILLSDFKIIRDLEIPAAYGDWDEWRVRLTHLDQTFFKACLSELQQRNTASIELYAVNHTHSQRFTLHPVNPWYFWRRNRSLKGWL